MKRREFVAGAGVLVGAGMLAGTAAPGAASANMPLVTASDSAPGLIAKPAGGRIDIHQHIVSPALADVLKRRNISHLAGFTVPEWTPEGALAVMQRDGVLTAITSLVMPGLNLEKDELSYVSRSSNEYSAQMGQKYPGRFGFFAHVPLPFTDQACVEAIYALDVLNADGVVLQASNDERFLGDPAFEELMTELNQRKATVFVHPNLHPSTTTLGLDTPPGVLEFSCDISRAALNLILSGTMERYPHIRWILAHAGGFLPYVAWRVSLANAMPEYADTATMGVLNYMRRFYFDTASSASRYAMATLGELVEPEKILFGSDTPYAVDGETQAQISALAQEQFWSNAMLAGVERSHALSLFPRFKLDGERLVAAPVYEAQPLGGQIARQLLKPVRSLAQRLRE